MKTKIALAAACLVCLIVNGIHKRTISILDEECGVYRQNMESLISGMDTLLCDISDKAYQINMLQLNEKEYKRHRQEDAAMIRHLQVKLKNVQSASKQVLEVGVPVSAPIRTDSVQLVNEHVSFVGILTKDSLKADIAIPITLFQIVHKIPKHKFLWLTWGTKGFKQIIHTDNPYVKLKYSEYIKIR